MLPGMSDRRRDPGRPKGPNKKAGEKGPNVHGNTGSPFNWERKQQFCEELAKCGNRAAACSTVGVSSAAVGKHIKSDDDFRFKVETAWNDYRASVEAEVHRRAMDGVVEPVYQGGKKVGDVVRYSDGLLTLLIKRHMPTEYRDKISIEQNVTGGLAVGLADLGGMDRESRDALRKILEREEGNPGPSGDDDE